MTICTTERANRITEWRVGKCIILALGTEYLLTAHLTSMPQRHPMKVFILIQQQSLFLNKQQLSNISCIKHSFTFGSTFAEVLPVFVTTHPGKKERKMLLLKNIKRYLSDA